MAKAKKIKQLSFVLPNKVGQLLAVSDLVAAEKVNIKSLLARESGTSAEFHLVTDDNAKASEALGRLNADVRQKDVMLVELDDKVGTLADAAKKLAEADINIEYTYGTTGSGDKAMLVFKTADDMKAAGLF